MNCDEFLAARETGGPFLRMRARRHAERCPRCAALGAAFDSAKREWASPEPLTPGARLAWERAAGGSAGPETPRNWIPIAMAGGLAVAACVALLVVTRAGHGPAGTTTPVPRIAEVGGPNQTKPGATTPAATTPSVTPPTVTVVSPSEELARLSEDADRLDAELKKLRVDARRIDARRQVAMTFEHFEKW